MRFNNSKDFSYVGNMKKNLYNNVVETNIFVPVEELFLLDNTELKILDNTGDPIVVKI